MYDFDRAPSRAGTHAEKYAARGRLFGHPFQRHRPKVMLFCLPHNPVGRVWSRADVAAIVGLTGRYGVCLGSDIIFPPHRHVSAALSLPEAGNSRVIVLNSAGKSFNAPGLNTAYALIADSALRRDFLLQLRRMNPHAVNLSGMIGLDRG